jgi:hypothetical protein
VNPEDLAADRFKLIRQAREHTAKVEQARARVTRPSSGANESKADFSRERERRPQPRFPGE